MRVHVRANFINDVSKNKDLMHKNLCDLMQRKLRSGYSQNSVKTVHQCILSRKFHQNLIDTNLKQNAIIYKKNSVHYF